MHDLLSAILRHVFSWWGLLLISFLDSSVFFFLPLAIDVGVIVLSARRPDLFWAYALLATAGSMCGSAITYYMGKGLGEAGLGRFVPEKRLNSLRERISRRGATAVALTTLAPPPFPFTAFVLAAGALEVDAKRFFIVLAPARLLRFGVEGILAYVYGRQIVNWLESPVVKEIGLGFLILVLGGSIITIIRAFRHVRAHRMSRRAA